MRWAHNNTLCLAVLNAGKTGKKSNSAPDEPVSSRCDVSVHSRRLTTEYCRQTFDCSRLRASPVG